MNRRRALAALALCACTSPPAAQPAEYLVTLAPAADEKILRDVYGRFGIESIQPLPKNVYLVTVRQDPGLAAMENARQGDERVKAVQRNQRYRRY